MSSSHTSPATSQNLALKAGKLIASRTIAANSSAVAVPSTGDTEVLIVAGITWTDGSIFSQKLMDAGVRIE
jgi:hypothetical protein